MVVVGTTTTDDNGFYGTFSAKVTGDQLVGALAASRANAGLVREGKATLTGKR